MIARGTTLVVAAFLALIVSGCSLLQGIEPPKVSVDSLRSLPADSSGVIAAAMRWITGSRPRSTSAACCQPSL